LRKVKVKNSDDVLKRREAAAKIKMHMEMKSRLSDTAALMHLDSIVALRFHPRNQRADMHYTALLKGHYRETNPLSVGWVRSEFEHSVIDAVDELGTGSVNTLGGFYGPSTGLLPLDDGNTATPTLEDSFGAFKNLDPEVRKFMVTKVIYSFTGFQAPSKRREHVSRNKVNWDPLKDPANLGMCKFTAVVKQVGQQEEVREAVSREWILDVFGEVWLDTLHSKVAYSNQKSTIEMVTKGRYEEDPRQVHAIRWNPDCKLYQGRVRKSSSDSEKTIDLDDAWVDKNFSARYKLDLKKLAANEKSKFVFVPPGDFRDKATLPKSLVVPGAPAVVFQQGTIDLCAVASMASVLSFIGCKSHAKLLYNTFQDNITAQGADTRIHSVRDHIMNSLDKKLWEMTLIC